MWAPTLLNVVNVGTIIRECS